MNNIAIRVSIGQMDKQRLSLRISKSRLERLRKVAKEREKTMTQLVEDWIDKLKTGEKLS